MLFNVFRKTGVSDGRVRGHVEVGSNGTWNTSACNASAVNFSGLAMPLAHPPAGWNRTWWNSTAYVSASQDSLCNHGGSAGL